MMYWVYFGLTFFLTMVVCRALLFPKSSFSWKMNFLALGLPLAIPYRLVEKSLLDSGGGLSWAFLSGCSVTVIEFALLFFLISFGAKKMTIPEPFETIFPRFFFLGFHFGWGRVCRDSLLLFVHTFSLYYGYSQFITFPSFFFLLPKMMEILLDAQIASFLGMAVFSSNSKSLSLFFIALVFKGASDLLQTAIQFVPPLRFFASLYFTSFLPLLLIVGLILLSRLKHRVKEKP